MSISEEKIGFGEMFRNFLNSPSLDKVVELGKLNILRDQCKTRTEQAEKEKINNIPRQDQS
jgi:hypothetical protein